MIKLVEIEDVPTRGQTAKLIQEFVDSEMSQAKLDLTNETRSPQSVYSGIYGYLRARTDIKVTIVMRDGDLILIKGE